MLNWEIQICSLCVFLLCMVITLVYILCCKPTKNKVVDNAFGYTFTFLLTFSIVLFLISHYRPDYYDVNVYEKRIEKCEQKIENTQLIGKAKEMYIKKQESKMLEYNEGISRIILKEKSK